MTAPEPPVVYWSTLIGPIQESEVGYWRLVDGRWSLILNDPLPADAVRLIPTTGEVDEPLHEVVCPSCGAAIRARMADAPIPVADVGAGPTSGDAMRCWDSTTAYNIPD
jgi:hypothetical protein